MFLIHFRAFIRILSLWPAAILGVSFVGCSSLGPAASGGFHEDTVSWSDYPTYGRMLSASESRGNKVYRVDDPVWGVLQIETFKHPSPRDLSVEVKTFVHCKNQKTSSGAFTGSPKKELLTDEGFRVCEFEGHKFNKQTKVLTIMFNKRNGALPSEGDYCNEGWSQEFHLKELCEDWLPLNQRKKGRRGVSNAKPN